MVAHSERIRALVWDVHIRQVTLHIGRKIIYGPGWMVRDYYPVALSPIWLILKVNTRSIYHRLAKAQSSPDNMTLCPVLDFANHTYTSSSAYPQAERWDSRPSSRCKSGENFVLLSPSTVTILSGEEIFLRYGMHSNSTLFTEYGFVNVVDWSNLPEGFSAEVDMDNHVEPLFEQKGEVGQWMKNILQEEGYWGYYACLFQVLHVNVLLQRLVNAYITTTSTSVLSSYHGSTTSLCLPGCHQQLANNWA